MSKRAGRPCARRRPRIAASRMAAAYPVTPTATEATADCLVFLQHEIGAAPRLFPYDREKAVAKLEEVLCFGTSAVSNAQRAALAELAMLPVYRFLYSDFDEADLLLRSLTPHN